MMLNFESTRIGHLIVHKVGNKSREEGVQLSGKEIPGVEDYISELLMMYFTRPFDGNVMYNFFHDADLNLNEIYSYSASIFDNPSGFYEHSCHIANHLYEQSSHPKIKSGELYVVYFNDCVVEDELCDAIGIFKSENKDKYLRIMQQGDGFGLDFEDGININKLDKGCLIFNTEKEHGFKVCTVDKLNPTGEAAFWKDEFLRIKPRPDNFYMTKNIIELCKSFSEDCLTTENNVDKKEQVNFMAKTARYLEEKDNFDLQEFAREVIAEPEIIETFKSYTESFQEDYQLPELDQAFEIAPEVKKEVKKQFRSVVKLDRNFHIYIHSNPELVEKGYDDKRKMNYYKLFFNEES
jgi:hypothetical protein